MCFGEIMQILQQVQVFHGFTALTNSKLLGLTVIYNLHFKYIEY